MFNFWFELSESTAVSKAILTRSQLIRRSILGLGKLGCSYY